MTHPGWDLYALSDHGSGADVSRLTDTDVRRCAAWTEFGDDRGEGFAGVADNDRRDLYGWQVRCEHNGRSLAIIELWNIADVIRQGDLTAFCIANGRSATNLEVAIPTKRSPNQFGQLCQLHRHPCGFLSSKKRWGQNPADSSY